MARTRGRCLRDGPSGVVRRAQAGHPGDVSTSTLPSRAAAGVPLPGPRGPVSEALLEALTGARPTSPLPVAGATSTRRARTCSSPCTWPTSCTTARCPGVDDALEWDPDLLRLRARLEAPFLAALRADTSGSDDVDGRARAAAARAGARHRPVVAPGSRAGEPWQLREYAAHRSRLPPQGGRPAGLRRAAARRAGQGRRRHRAARRVRRRPGRAHARRAVRRRCCASSTSTTPTARTSTPRPPRPSRRATPCRCSRCTAACAARPSGSSS